MDASLSSLNQNVFIYLPSTRQSTAKRMPKTTVNLERTASFPLVLPPTAPSAPPPIAEPIPACLDSCATTTIMTSKETIIVNPIKKYFTVHPPPGLPDVPNSRASYKYKANIKPYFILICAMGQWEIYFMHKKETCKR